MSVIAEVVADWDPLLMMQGVTWRSIWRSVLSRGATQSCASRAQAAVGGWLTRCLAGRI